MYSSSNNRGGWIRPSAGRNLVVALISALAVVTTAPTLRGQGRQETTLTEADGTLEILYEDYTGGSRLHHFLNTPTGRLRLEFAGEPTALLTGSHVRARGRLSNGTLMLTSGSSVQALSVASAYTFGVQPTLVILVNFQDNATQPYTPATAQSVTFGETNSFYAENTYGQTSLAGDVTGWYTIPASSTTCDYPTWAALADQAATDAGVNVSSYGRRIYGFPQTNVCAWWGMGTVGGGTPATPSRAWINGSYALRVVGHELGHNFGDFHSHSLSCDPASCVASEYGDDRDIMGATTGHMNAFQKERLGWLNYGSSPAIQTVTATNNYWVEPLEGLSNGGPKALKILKSTDASGYRTWYYVETRAKIGVDAGVPSGVAIHTGSEATGNSSNQTDIQPSTTAWDSVLDVGQSFVDSTLGMTITTVSADNSGALVQVAFGAVPCTGLTPTVSLSPSAARWVLPGSTVSYTVSITSNDSSGCSPAVFNLAAAAPAGWAASFGSALLGPIAPGATATASLSLAVAASASGTSSFSVSAAENGVAAGTAGAGLVVAPSLALAVATDHATYKSNGTVTVTASVSAGSLVAAGATVTFSMTSASSPSTVITLSATAGANGVATAKYRVKSRDPKGVYQVRAVATKDNVIGSGNSSFSVQ
jgi:hypothetical protein